MVTKNLPKPLAGIYVIRHIASGRVYIGSSNDLNSRFRSHVKRLRKNKHSNANLQKDFNIYGENAFEFEVIEICLAEIRLEREQHYLDTSNNLYNIAISAQSSWKGLKRNSNFKEKQRLNGLNQKHSDKTKNKLAEINRGKKASLETRRKMSEARQGEKGPFFGKHHSEETKKHLRVLAKERGGKPIIGKHIISGDEIMFWTILSAKELGFHQSNIIKAIKSEKPYKGYTWRKQPE